MDRAYGGGINPPYKMDLDFWDVLKRKNYMYLTKLHKTDVHTWSSAIYILFNSTAVISGQWVGDNKTLCALETRLQVKKSLPQAGFEPRSSRPAINPMGF